MSESAALDRALEQEQDAPEPRRRDTVLVLAQGPEWNAIARLARTRGYLVLDAASIFEALAHMREARPDLVLLPGDPQGFELLDRLRSGGSGTVSAIVLTRAGDLKTLVDAFDRGADDVVAYDADPAELGARIQARLERRAVPRTEMLRDPVTNAYTEESLATMLRLEIERVGRVERPVSFAFLAFHELPVVASELGQRARDAILAEVVDLVEADGRKLDAVGFARDHLALLLPDTPARGAEVRLSRLVRKLYDHTFVVEGASVQLTPVVGFVDVTRGLDADEVQSRAWVATMHAADQLDLHATRWNRHLESATSPARGNRLVRWLDRRRTTLQVVAQQLACLGGPLLLYLLLARAGVDFTGTLYLAVVIALAFTSLVIWIECLAAFRPRRPPESPIESYPPGSAIIPAYLPNEAATIVESVEAVLDQDYDDLQVILAYNTPEDLPVEDELRAIAARDPRFTALRVHGSVSKAQNVNVALAQVRGEFVAIFDADHHPAPGAFKRAWRWLANGDADVVQGHCVVRNGDDGALQRLIAAEFEAMYAVSHPGRARLHGFGIFGGSNGYWRTSVLRLTRLRSFMLTEDIDSSMRILASGGKIVSDPGLLSTELAPGSWSALWNQRLRWAQGWSQVALRYLWDGLRNRQLSLRQKVGLAYLLGWREIYPWISLQTFPILAFWMLRGSPPVSWFVPVFVATTLFTFSAGVVQAWSAWRLAAPELRKRGRWFLLLGAVSQLVYVEFKNVITRTAHLKEGMRERKWKVTPRATRLVRPVKPIR
jgi:cellulose synthase/poly-beta-1,6-N-acetylglucosamine synthase-like glycosyltransferase/DNA-binding response OmpR family regulator